ncbi:MAG: nucleotidyltransferase domain-containing protein [Deferrisomatales bacterium]|nr:nucleotidyltransferase domain-containing protein [Deferrisomatales bacterium]
MVKSFLFAAEAGFEEQGTESLAMGNPLSAASEQIKRAAARQIRLRDRRREAAHARVADARSEVERLARVFLKIDPALEKLILFGSLARGDVTTSDFDIDLAVAGSRDSFLRLVAEALNSPFDVDLVDLDAADERIRRSILRDGIVLYEK